jgi:hypothetical protein
MNLQRLFVCLFVRATAAVAEDCPELFRGAKEVIKKGGLSTHQKTECSSSALKLSCNGWVFARLLLLLKSVLLCEEHMKSSKTSADYRLVRIGVF